MNIISGAKRSHIKTKVEETPLFSQGVSLFAEQEAKSILWQLESALLADKTAKQKKMGIVASSRHYGFR